MHATELSDPHSEASHADPPNPPHTLLPCRPSPLPDTVTKLPAPSAPFSLRMALTPSLSKLIPPVIEPTATIPTVNITAALPPLAEPTADTRQSSMLELAQVVASHAVVPTDADMLLHAPPISLPVISNDNTAPAPRPALRIASPKPTPSNDKASLIVPLCTPAVITNDLDPSAPMAFLHTTPESDIQPVCPHALCPSLIPPDMPPPPNCDPNTVIDPVNQAAVFPLASPLSSAASYVAAPDKLEIRKPAVKTTGLDDDMLNATWHLVAESDTHTVASHPECPVLISGLKATFSPTPTNNDARAIEFDTGIPPSSETSVDKAPDTLSPLMPVVTTKCWLPRAPSPTPTLHLTCVADSHVLASHAVDPSRPLPDPTNA
jgi:hypothetical protein